jgi:4'-phosphopantetheinyl transferase EntD
MGAGGEPVWPQGISGSLSHTATNTVVLIARSAHHASVGVDIDDQRLLSTAAAEELMTPDEVAVVLAQGWTSDIAIAQNLAFLAKEALFKYQYPITRKRELEFDDVHLKASEDTGVLAAWCGLEDNNLQRVLASARIFFGEIQGVRICWTLPRASSSKNVGFSDTKRYHCP